LLTPNLPPEPTMHHAFAALFLSTLLAADTEGLLKQLRSVGREGAGNVEAAAAWKDLVQVGPSALLPTLAALEGATPAAANWLRTAVDAIAERELAAGRPLPTGAFEAFIKDAEHNPAARRQAYEWLVKVDKGAPDRLLPGMLLDPSVELRRDAVARVLTEAEQLFSKNKTAATAAYRKALGGARDQD